MQDNNIKEEVNVTKEENVIEGFEITENATELDKKQFFKMLAKADEGLALTIERVGKIFISKYDSDKVGCFIDYTFTEGSTNYEIGIYYSLGKPVITDYDKEGNPIYKVKITKDMNLFKIVAGIYKNLANAKDFKATEELLKNNLTGKTFKAEVGTSYNGGFLIEPVELLEG